MHVRLCKGYICCPVMCELQLLVWHGPICNHSFSKQELLSTYAGRVWSFASYCNHHCLTVNFTMCHSHLPALSGSVSSLPSARA